jgi:hypothetical protein
MFKVFDIEAYEWNKVYAIGIYDGITLNSYAHSDTKNDIFIKWLLDNLNDKDIVYAHNGGKYDFLFLLNYIKKYKIKIREIKIIHASLVMIRIEYNKKLIEFRDSFAILPVSLKQLTIDFDVEHKKLEMDYNLGLNDTKFKEYFENDLKGLYEVLARSDDLTNSYTIASASMKIFLNKFYSIKPSNNSFKIDDIFRKGYYGGRVEIFKMYGENLHYYDINSLYPSVMYDNKFPLLENYNYRYTNEYIPNKLGYYYCRVSVPESEYIPLLPYRAKDGKLLFPSGSWSGWYYSPEVAKAIDLGYDIKVLKGYTFSNTDYIFKNFVGHYYDIKKNSSGAKRFIAKLILNSLYGKFGQHRDFDNFVISPEAKYMYYPFLNVAKVKGLSYAKYIHSEIAGLITSYARLKLYSLFEKAGKEHVYYCDTDSIITSKELNTSNDLGDIKAEDDIKSFIAINPKVYAYISNKDDKISIKAKGLNSKLLKYQDFENALYHNDFSAFIYNFERLATFKEVKVRKLNNFSDKLKTIRQMRKHYSKRYILANFDTKSIEVN